MITQTSRPNTLSSMAGHPLVKKTLRSIIANPKDAPRSLLFSGLYGTGKTSASRILSRCLNCTNLQKNGDPCLKCSNCTEDLSSSPFYQEYDAAIVGNVESIRELRDTFYVSISSGFRVICFDEVHVCSKAAQNTLLKAVEEVPTSVFFVFATTDPDMVLNTICSRSLPIVFHAVSHSEIVKNLKSILHTKDLTFSDSILNVIASKSQGHMRDAHMMLDSAILIGESDFLSSIRTFKTDFMSFFLAIAKKDKTMAFDALDVLGTAPLADLKVDFQSVCLELIQSSVGYNNSDPAITELAKTLGPDVFKIVKLGVTDWVLSSFTSDLSFKTAMLCMFQMLAMTSGPSTPTASPLNRALKR